MHPRAPSADAPHPAVPPAPPAPCKGADQHQQLSWQPLHAQRCSTPHQTHDLNIGVLAATPRRRARHRNPPLSNDLATDRPNHPTTQTIEPPNHPNTHRRTWFWSWFSHSEDVCFLFLLTTHRGARHRNPTLQTTYRATEGRAQITQPTTSPSKSPSHHSGAPRSRRLRQRRRHSQTLCRRDPDNAHHHPTTTKSPNHPHHPTSMRQGATSASGGNFRVLGSVSC